MTATPEDAIVLRFVHTADWHLGKRFSRFRDEAKLTQARCRVLEGIFGVARKYDADAVLCAGDLFDEPNPGPEWWQPLVQCLAQTPKDRPIVLLPGNHDPYRPDSVWAPGQPFRKALPRWVHVVEHDRFTLDLPGNAVVYGVPCTSQSGQQDPTARIPRREAGDDRIRIGLVHGSTFDVEGCQTNFPISADAAVDRGLDYLAIGDTHGFRYVPADRKIPPTIYPGAPEPTAFDEKDAGCVAVVQINRQRRARVEPERVAYWTWEEHRITSLDELRALRRRSDLASRVLRLAIDMSLAAPDYEEADAILRELEGSLANPARVGVLDLDREGLALDTGNLESLCEDFPDVLKVAVRLLKEEERKPDRAEVARRALMHLYRTAKKAS